MEKLLMQIKLEAAGAGAGLGLNTVYDTVINKNNGRIEIDSEHGYYTELKIFIPILIDN